MENNRGGEKVRHHPVGRGGMHTHTYRESRGRCTIQRYVQRTQSICLKYN